MVADNLKRGANPSTDSAILSIRNEKLIPEVLYEYKPVVDGNMSRVDQLALVESCLQSKYVIQYYGKQSIVQCLTDMTYWHYIKFSVSDTSSLNVDWYYRFTNEDEDEITSEDIQRHLKFLFHSLGSRSSTPSTPSTSGEA